MASIKKFFILEIVALAIVILFSLSISIGENVYANIRVGVDRATGLQSSTITNQSSYSNSILHQGYATNILGRHLAAQHRKNIRITGISHGKAAWSALPITRNLFPDCLHQIGQYYGWHKGIFEYGTDFDCAYHTKIPNLWAGTVVQAERTCWNTTCTSSSGAVVVIYAYVPGLGFEDTYYLHLDIISVKVGQTIDKYNLIGYTGGTTYGYNPTSPWFSSGAHLEMGFNAPFLRHDKGENVNPLSYIEAALR